MNQIQGSLSLSHIRSNENLKSKKINIENQHKDREQKTVTQYENYKGDETVVENTKDKENYPYHIKQFRIAKS